MKKFVTAVVAATVAVGTLSVPAYANTQQKSPVTGLGILPILAGPIGAAALVGPSSTYFTQVKYFKFYKWQSWGWNKIHYLKDTGWQVEKKFHYNKVKVHAERTSEQRSTANQGKAVVGCIMGSALGAITAAVRKGNALGNPIAWRSQAEHEAIVKSGYEKQFELTNDEAAIALSLCGLGSLMLNWQKTAPAVVKAKF